ncbi:hypothetical protein [Nostoc sp.]|uniref:hypothetical protein n=1 Tax=Nostoc sp. TaxID=1180 RepID=UPI002FF9C9F3
MAKPLPITKIIAVINNNSVMSRGLILPPNYTIRPAINRTDKWAVYRLLINAPPDLRSFYARFGFVETNITERI